jgi:hypothetical protein
LPDYRLNKIQDKVKRAVIEGTGTGTAESLGEVYACKKNPKRI